MYASHPIRSVSASFDDASLSNSSSSLTSTSSTRWPASVKSRSGSASARSTARFASALARELVAAGGCCGMRASLGFMFELVCTSSVATVTMSTSTDRWYCFSPCTK